MKERIEDPELQISRESMDGEIFIDEDGVIIE